MKIENSALSLNCQHTKTEYTEKKETLTVWLVDTRIDVLQISERAKKSLELTAKAMQPNTEPLAKAEHLPSPEADELAISSQDKLKITLLERFIEKLTQKKFKFYLPKLKLKELNENDNAINTKQLSAQPNNSGWGIRYDYRETHFEQERMSFAAQGYVTTKDGQKVTIDLSLTMSREFISQTELHFRAGDATLVDPLVINFEGTAAELTSTRFSFDLDADRTLDQISFLKPQSGFLVLDRNNDGVINNGQELFGTQSGDGFRDLAEYDVDQNCWIDENDPIFERLQIWTKDENGQDLLFALGQKGIGAIYLGNITTPFAIKNTNNQLNGEVQKSGIFLQENGSAGTIQHINLAI